MRVDNMEKRKGRIKIVNHPGIMESGVYECEVEVAGETVVREFEVGVKVNYHHVHGDDYGYGYDHEGIYGPREVCDVTVKATCCNEEDEEVADVMECRLEEAVEDYVWEYG